jgi:peptidoglycan/xylan/chitin deacetylase (PgdA/CDA1 family)
VTVFVTTGFLDGQLWLWWDRVAWAFEQTGRTSCVLTLPSERRGYRWSGPPERARVQHEAILRLEWLDAPERDAAIAALIRELEVEVPATPPARYAPMRWDDVRRAATRGVTFGPHTVTHRILSGAPLAACQWEIQESYRRVRQETTAVVPVLCYPNGEPRAFGQREIDAAQLAGLQGAVTAVRGYAASDGARRFALARFSYPDDRPHLVQIVAGLARVTARGRPARQEV